TPRTPVPSPFRTARVKRPMIHVAAILNRLALLARHRFGACLGVLLLGTLVAACGEPPTATEDPVAVRTEPGELVFHPDTRPVKVSLVNISDEPVRIDRVRIDEGTPDWVGF